MAFRCAFSTVALVALLSSVAAIQVVPVPASPKGWVVPGVADIPNISNLSISQTARTLTQASEQRLGPPMLESEVCPLTQTMFAQIPVDPKRSEWRHQDPIQFPMAGIGARRRMVELGGMEYELFLPMHWKNDSAKPYPVVVYLHGWGERKWSVMNSESLPRLLARNQSTSFNSFGCWCTDATQFTGGKAKVFTDPGDTSVGADSSFTEDWTGPMADCDFADNFEAIAILPKADADTPNWGVWPSGDNYSVRRKKEADGLGPHYPTWTGTLDLQARDIAKFVIGKFNGDADRVVLTGTAEGASGAMAMAKADPSLYSALILTDPTEALDPTGLDYMPVMVSADNAAGQAYVDALVVALKSRTNGLALTKYARFVESPKAADPLFRAGKHTADLLYRHPDTWKWAFNLYSGQFYDTKDYSGAIKWGEPERSWVDMGYNPTRPPLDTGAIVPGAVGADYNPTRPPADYGYNPTMPPIVTGYNPTMAP